MEKEVLVRDMMARKVISVFPETSVIEAAKLISDHNFDGIPVIDRDNKLIGILTEYDLITKTSSINMSFLQRIIYDIYNASKDSEGKRDEKSLNDMTVKDIMNREPLFLKEDATFNQIIEAFVAHHKVNPIPIVDNSGKLVGVVSRFDVLRPLNLLGYRTNK